MIGLLKELYGSRSLQFTSEFGLAESIARLTAGTFATRAAANSAGAAAAVVGDVSKDYVNLFWYIRNDRTWMRPHYVGKFEETPGGVRLSGFLVVDAGTKVMSALFTMVTLAFTFEAGARGLGQGGSWLIPGTGLFLLACEIGGLYIARYLKRNDKGRLEACINGALRSSKA